MRIAVVGAGRVGTALAVLWRAAGHEIVAVSGDPERARKYLADVPVVEPVAAPAHAEIVVIGVPDDAIAGTASALADGGRVAQGAVVAHLSGAGGLDRLGALQNIRPLCLHPLQTFPSVDDALRYLDGSPMAVTADSQAVETIGFRLAIDAGTVPFALDEASKPLYHAAAVFTSNALVAVLGAGQELMREAGADAHALEALARSSFGNAMAAGPAAALTGPAVRGDAETVDSNLAAIAASAPDLVPTYIAITRLALRVGGARVSPRAASAIEEVLARWS